MSESHQQSRARLLAAFRTGDPCGYCGQPVPDPPAEVTEGGRHV